jgi:antitoxin MazE
MRAKIRKIGNSRGIILPKDILDRCNLHDEVELFVSEENKLIVQPILSKRNEWEKAFQKAKQEGVLDKADFIANKFDEEEWEW